MSHLKIGAAVRESALTEAYGALERVLAVGLTDMRQPALEELRQRVLDGCLVEFTVSMGAKAGMVCNFVAPDRAQRVELFRVEFGECSAALSVVH